MIINYRGFVWKGTVMNEANSQKTVVMALQAENDQLRGVALWALMHHQGGSSPVGQPLRKALGIAPYADMTQEQYATAKKAAGAWGPAELIDGLSAGHQIAAETNNRKTVVTDYSFLCYSCGSEWERQVSESDCPKCGTTNSFCAENPRDPMSGCTRNPNTCSKPFCDECWLTPQVDAIEGTTRHDGSVSFEEAQDIARKHAKAEPESYYSERFEPHLWVINAIIEASATWYGRAVEERIKRGAADRAANEAQKKGSSRASPVAQVVAVDPPGPDGHGVNWLAGKRPKPGDLLFVSGAAEPVDVRIYWHAGEGWQVEWRTPAPNGGQSNYYRRAEPQVCRDDGRCQYAIDHGAEGMGHCPEGKCRMPPDCAHAADPK